MMGNSSFEQRRHKTHRKLAISILLSALCATVLIMLLNWLLGSYFPGLSAIEGFDLELLARLALVWIIMFLYMEIFLLAYFVNSIKFNRRLIVALTLLGFGCLFALADPYHPVRHEDNWIRYATAGVLSAAGVVALRSGLKSSFPLPDRIIGGAFGLALLAGAADELFQIHERLGRRLDLARSSEPELAGQDMVMLILAAIGILTAVAATILWRRSRRIDAQARVRKYGRVLEYFVLAVICFAAAMLLDSFDNQLGALANRVQAMSLDPVGNDAIGYHTAGEYVKHFANSLEELLEYTAATLFLLTIGALFSISILGFDIDGVDIPDHETTGS